MLSIPRTKTAIVEIEFALISCACTQHEALLVIDSVVSREKKLKPWHETTLPLPVNTWNGHRGAVCRVIDNFSTVHGTLYAFMPNPGLCPELSSNAPWDFSLSRAQPSDNYEGFVDVRPAE